MKITRKTTILEIGCLVCEALREAGISAFLSGGAVVSIYTKNQYESFDLDFVSYGDRKRISEVMESIGFVKGPGRHFIHPDTQYFVEFPGLAAAIGDQLIEDFAEMKSKAGVLTLLTPTDCVMDRLSAYYHWKDEQSLEQAILVAKSRKIDLDRIKDWSGRERMAEKFQVFQSRILPKRK